MKRIISLLSALVLAATLCIGAPLSALAVEGQEPIGGEIAVTGDMLPEGIYDIDVVTDSSMFSVADCRLDVQGGVMTATLTSSDAGFERIYLGASDQAATGDPALTGDAVADGGAYTYTVEVPALNIALPCSVYSGATQGWYDFNIVFQASSLDGSILPAYLYLTENPNPMTSAAETDLEAGTYTMDVVLSGGSGKASVTSPCTVTVVGGKATATVEWSSEFYDYMVVDGYIYYPTNTEGNSTFEIPVVAYDEPFDVIGDTIAMSTPHEIAYTLTFDSTTAKASGGVNGFVLPTVIGVLAIIVIVIIVVLVRGKKKKAVDDEITQ